MTTIVGKIKDTLFDSMFIGVWLIGSLLMMPYLLWEAWKRILTIRKELKHHNLGLKGLEQ